MAQKSLVRKVVTFVAVPLSLYIGANVLLSNSLRVSVVTDGWSAVAKVNRESAATSHRWNEKGKVVLGTNWDISVEVYSTHSKPSCFFKEKKEVLIASNPSS